MSRMPRPHRSRLSALAALTAVLIAFGGAAAGCSPPAPTPTPSSADAGVQVWIHQQRGDEQRRRALVRVKNDSTRALDISAIRIVDDRLGGAVRADGGRVAAGESFDFPLVLPASACDGGSPDRRWELQLADGTDRTGVLTDALGFLGRLNERECLEKALATTLQVSWHDAVLPASGPGVLPLEITPMGIGGDARVVAVQSTPLLQFGSRTTRFPVPDGKTLVDVPIEPQRCDPHVVQEDKRGTVFALEVDVDGSTGVVDVPVSDDERGRILSWVAERCHFGG
ncbi:hypothetical protein BWL13_02059 [Microbacterium oleivorans]|uniref:hypothetical protein n=1 Tax=Microbacterium oleivorans TaxID=273677 RepID=UPI000F8F9D97|nr:hypothetical protein [Microbacterium oleivorans]AZS44470.1 hypothetical protein BWL13_02059 [Microbacterium oleivorans]